MNKDWDDAEVVTYSFNGGAIVVVRVLDRRLEVERDMTAWVEEYMASHPECVRLDEIGCPRFYDERARRDDAEIKRLRAALQELVDLKDMKDAIGPPHPMSRRLEMESEYRRRKRAAWRRARLALNGEDEA